MNDLVIGSNYWFIDSKGYFKNKMKVKLLGWSISRKFVIVTNKACGGMYVEEWELKPI